MQVSVSNKMATKWGQKENKPTILNIHKLTSLLTSLLKGMHKVLKKKKREGEEAHYSSFYMLHQEKLALFQNVACQLQNR